MSGCGCNQRNPISASKSYKHIKDSVISGKIKGIEIYKSIQLQPDSPQLQPNPPQPNPPQPNPPQPNPPQPNPPQPINNPLGKLLVNKKYKNIKVKQLDMYYSRFTKGEFEYLSKSELRSWDRIHKLAANANTPQLKEEFEKYIRYLAFNFPCPRCQPHIKERMLTHPIKNYYFMLDEKGREIGVAKWSWEFHNAVNERLGKSPFPWETFVDRYLN